MIFIILWLFSLIIITIYTLVENWRNQINKWFFLNLFGNVWNWIECDDQINNRRIKRIITFCDEYLLSKIAESTSRIECWSRGMTFVWCGSSITTCHRMTGWQLGLDTNSRTDPICLRFSNLLSKFITLYAKKNVVFFLYKNSRLTTI